jgi:hypothetical protein
LLGEYNTKVPTKLRQPINHTTIHLTGLAFFLPFFLFIRLPVWAHLVLTLHVAQVLMARFDFPTPAEHCRAVLSDAEGLLSGESIADRAQKAAAAAATAEAGSLATVPEEEKEEAAGATSAGVGAKEQERDAAAELAFEALVAAVNDSKHALTAPTLEALENEASATTALSQREARGGKLPSLTSRKPQRAPSKAPGGSSAQDDAKEDEAFVKNHLWSPSSSSSSSSSASASASAAAAASFCPAQNRLKALRHVCVESGVVDSSFFAHTHDWFEALAHDEYAEEEKNNESERRGLRRRKRPRPAAKRRVVTIDTLRALEETVRRQTAVTASSFLNPDGISDGEGKGGDENENEENGVGEKGGGDEGEEDEFV